MRWWFVALALLLFATMVDAVCDPDALTCDDCTNYFNTLYEPWTTALSGSGHSQCQSENQSIGGNGWLYVRNQSGCRAEVAQWANYTGFCIEAGSLSGQAYCPSFDFLGTAVVGTDCNNGDTGLFDFTGSEPILADIDFTDLFFAGTTTTTTSSTSTTTTTTTSTTTTTILSGGGGSYVNIRGLPETTPASAQVAVATVVDQPPISQPTPVSSDNGNIIFYGILLAIGYWITRRRRR